MVFMVAHFVRLSLTDARARSAFFASLEVLVPESVGCFCVLTTLRTDFNFQIFRKRGKRRDFFPKMGTECDRVAGNEKWHVHANFGAELHEGLVGNF